MSAKQEEQKDVEEEVVVNSTNQDDDSKPASQFSFSDAMLPYAGCLGSAIVLLVALTSKDIFRQHKYYEYGIAVAVVAMFFSLVGYVDSTRKNNTTHYVSYFLFLWCFVGACFMTFGGPFKTTGNGYFASWGMVIFSTMGLGITDQLKDGGNHLPSGTLLGLLAASIIQLTAIASEGYDNERGELIYATILACFSVLLSLSSFKGLQEKVAVFPVMVVFAIGWVISAGLVTFRGPFLNTGNGYFGSWGGAVAATFAAFESFTRGNDE